MTDPGESRTTALLITRLVQRHDLTPEEAALAVRQARAKEPGPHTHLVGLEAATILLHSSGPIREMAKALRALGDAVKRAAAELVKALQPIATQLAARRDRPAWMSPYGPPIRRRFP